MIAYVPLIVALIGLLMFMLIRNAPDWKRVGEILFQCGAFISLLAYVGRMVKVF